MSSAGRAPSIFVQLPAYRDSELGPTLRSLYATAAAPEQLRTVVCLQRDDADPELPADVVRLPQLTVVTVPAAQSRGPNWARRRLQVEYAGEDLTLMLDSHMRFTDGWDQQAVAMLDSLRDRGVDRPVLTGYLPAYLPGPHERRRSGEPMKIYPLSREDGILTRLTSYRLPRWHELTAPPAAEFLSLHFVLAAGEFNTEVPHDPEIYFFGDEVALGCRAFTHGWSMFHPHRVLGWHAYDRRARVGHWDGHPEWGDAHRATLARLRGLFTGRPEFADLLGTARSVQDYEAHIMHRLVDGRAPNRVG